MIHEEPRIECPNPPGLMDDERVLLNELYEVWSDKLSRNQLKKKYYEQKNAFDNIGIAIPDNVKSKLRPVVGWPAKAVDALASRSRLEGFVARDGGIGELDAILAENGFAAKYDKAKRSELIHSCAFFTVTKGGPGEPAAVISVYSAETAAALWDYRGNRIKAGLCVVDFDRETGEPTQMNLHTDKAVVEIAKADGYWKAVRKPHRQGRPLMEAMTYRSELGRPFGKSRISRAVMSITDSAVRTVARTELSSEFFTSPQKYLLGASKDVVNDKTKLEASLGAVFALTKDEDGDIPKYGQLSQASMQPHTETLRSLAAQFAGETYIPISYLGVIHDNPASAEAMYAASEELIIAAEDMNRENGIALRNVALLALAVAGNKTVSRLDDEVKTVMPVFANPNRASIAARADAMAKIVGILPWVGQTRVALEWLGFSDSEIARLESDKRRANGQALAQSILGQEREGPKVGDIMGVLKNYTSGSMSEASSLDMLARLGLADDEARALLSQETADVAQGE